MKRLVFMVCGFLLLLGCGDEVGVGDVSSGGEASVLEEDATTVPFGDESDASTPRMPPQGELFCGDCGPADGPCGAWDQDPKTCECTPVLVTGDSCDDGNPCTEGDACGDDGLCVGATNVQCDDGEGCTTDVCDPEVGCVFEPVSDGEPCNDGDACTMVDVCQDGVCTGADNPCPDDGNPCTVASGCNDETGECLVLNVPDGTLCDDGNDCTAEDQCVGGACMSESNTECFDNNPCTDDGCNPKGGCTFFPNEAFCDDDSLCTTNDQCLQGQCNGGVIACDDGNPCTNDGCDPESGCVHEPVSIPCEDGNLCTVNDQCAGAQCMSGEQKICDDGNNCTTEYCDLGTGNCDYGYNNNPCDDQNICTDNDSCVLGLCQGIVGLACDDGQVCTADSCDPVTGCVSVLVEFLVCSDGNACTTGDVCTQDGCAGEDTSAVDCNDGNVCTTDACEPVTGCSYSSNTLVCDDGNSCTVGDLCIQGLCVGGVAEGCDDNDPCTDDTCDGADGCVNTPNTESCEDGNACTAGDSCLEGECESGSPVSCFDDNPCTLDACNLSIGCVNTPNVNCDDGIACTVDSCTPENGCVHVPDNSVCQTGEACLTDVCDVSAGCTSDLTPNCCGNGLVEGEEECDDSNINSGDGCDANCLTEGVGGCFDDWLVGSTCNGTNYGNGCVPQDTGYHYMGEFSGYACWWHHKNQAWNTTPASNFWSLGEAFGITPGVGKCGWCFNKFSTPDPLSLQTCDGYFQQGNVGAWGWCAESDPDSVGFVCLPVEGNQSCP